MNQVKHYTVDLIHVSDLQSPALREAAASRLRVSSSAWTPEEIAEELAEQPRERWLVESGVAAVAASDETGRVAEALVDLLDGLLALSADGSVTWSTWTCPDLISVSAGDEQTAAKNEIRIREAILAAVREQIG